MFVWKALRRALPVGTRLADRHIHVDSRCKRCGEPESITHLQFHCQFAKDMWLAAPFNPGFDSSGIIDFMECWEHLKNLTCLPPTGLVTGNLSPWILWSLWIARNNLLFNNRTSKPEDILTKAIAGAREWQNGQAKTQLQKKEASPSKNKRRESKMQDRCGLESFWKYCWSRVEHHRWKHAS